MNTLFDKSSHKDKTNYTAEHIEVLEGLEAVRKRPGMYIGGIDSKGLHHLAVEIIDNAIDEALAGYATEISVTLVGEKKLRVKDNGRGIPVDVHPKYKKSALEIILTTLHSGGKFHQSAYKTSGGLHGVGLSVVNALSKSLCVSIVRAGVLWQQSYQRGVPISSLVSSPLSKNSSNSTTIEFQPDPDIFLDIVTFDPEYLINILKIKALLTKGVRIFWSHVDLEETIKNEEVFYYPQGILGFIQQNVSSEQQIIVNSFYQDFTLLDGEERVECAITWVRPGAEKLMSFCNTIVTPQGGTHESGFRMGVVKALKSFAEHHGYKKFQSVTSEDIFEHCYALVSTFIKEPLFQGQTKEKLVNKYLSKSIESALKDRLEQWLITHKETTEALLEDIILYAERKAQAKVLKDTQKTISSKRKRLPLKLVDCMREGKGTEVFLVEGDSAGGSAKQARDRFVQAILPLRGKILNVASATEDKIIMNQEVRDIILSLGCGIGKDCQPEKLRYEKVIIMTDADVDGSHIAALLITFFFLQMRPLLEEGHIYLAQPPLFKISNGRENFYVTTEQEKKAIEKKIKGSSIVINRFKGLGEMRPVQLKETTMDPNKRKLLQVRLPTSLEDAKQVYAFITGLMGRDARRRFEFIQDKASFVKDLDF